jgi:hypothetical protein
VLQIIKFSIPDALFGISPQFKLSSSLHLVGKRIGLVNPILKDRAGLWLVGIPQRCYGTNDMSPSLGLAWY